MGLEDFRYNTQYNIVYMIFKPKTMNGTGWDWNGLDCYLEYSNNRSLTLKSTTPMGM